MITTPSAGLERPCVIKGENVVDGIAALVCEYSGREGNKIRKKQTEEEY